MERQPTYLIMDECLSDIIPRAQWTQSFLNDKRAQDKLKNARGETRIVENNDHDIYILQQIIKIMRDLERTSKNPAVSRNHPSRELMEQIESSLSAKNTKLLDNIAKELGDLPLVNKSFYYQIIDAMRNNISNQNTLNHAVVSEFYSEINQNVPKWCKTPEDFEREATRIMASSKSRKMHTSKSKSTSNVIYRIKDGSSPDEYWIPKPTYQETSDIIRATMKFFRGEQEKSYKMELLGLTKAVHSADIGQVSNINTEFKHLLEAEIEAYQNRIRYMEGNSLSKHNMQRLLEGLEERINQKYFYEKSIIIYKRIIDFLDKELQSGRKTEIISKMKKEMNTFNEQLQKVEIEIRKLEEQFNKEEQLAQKKQTTDMNQESLKPQRKGIFKRGSHRTSKLTKEELQKLKERLEEVPNKNNTVSEDSKSATAQNTSKEEQKNQLTQEEEASYAKYERIREQFESIDKNAFIDKTYYQRKIVDTFWNWGLGTTYEEIIENIKNMRNEQVATKDIKEIIEKMKKDYADIDSMFQLDENGLTKFENRLIGRLSGIQTDESLREETRKEIHYYIKKMENLEADLRVAMLYKNSYSKEDFDQLMKNLRVTNYQNTLLMEETPLMSLKENAKSMV